MEREMERTSKDVPNMLSLTKDMSSSRVGE